MLQVVPPPHRPPRQRWWPGAGKLLLVALTWAVAAFVVLGAAAATRIGPVLYEISNRHGIHAADVLVGITMFCLALLVTAVIVWPRRLWY